MHSSFVTPSTRLRHVTKCCAAAAAIIALSAAPARAFEEWHDAVDYTRLRNALGPLLPTGAGVPVSYAEAPAIGTSMYFLDLANGEFTGPLDPDELPAAVADGSGGAANGVSGHSTNVAQRFFGDISSAAPGANNIRLYEANNWLQNQLLYDSTPGDATHPGPPNAQPFRVQNHSWIGSFGSTTVFSTEDARNVDALRRFDYVLDTANDGDGMTAAVGLANDMGPMPYLLGHSYNAIVVGRTDGGHSRGGTLVWDGVGANDTYGPGRLKPDVVGPRPQSIFNNTTSMATAMVSSTAALLYDAASGTDAAKSEVVKAMIMAGATKGEFATYTDPLSQPVPGAAHPWGINRSPTRPLDEIFGAGELNVYNSYLTNLGGQTAGVQGAPAAAAGAYGWDYQDFTGQAGVGDISYKFQVPIGSTAPEFSIILAWNAEITDTDATAGFAPVQSLQNLNLQLFNSLGGLIDQSISTLDNVEHIYRTNLAAGEYTLKVNGAADWDYGLAWRMSTEFIVKTSDFDGNGFVDGGDFLTWQRNFGTLLGATRTDGDYDGDADVDFGDLAGFQASQLPASLAQYGLATSSGSGAGAVIPEPSSLASALVAASLLRWAKRNSRRLRPA
jgi:hypothetical protein